MPQPDQTAIWAAVAIVLAIVVVLLAVTAIRRRGSQDFEVRPLPADRVEPYGRRLDDLERLFVTKPRQAVASAREVVDEMLVLKGYPARLAPDGRARDIAFTNRGHASRYRSATVVDDRSSTEEMRQAMMHFLAVGRELLSESESMTPAAATPRPPDGTEAPQPVFEREPAGKRGEREFAG
jgi:hypothetical protein